MRVVKAKVPELQRTEKERWSGARSRLSVSSVVRVTFVIRCAAQISFSHVSNGRCSSVSGKTLGRWTQPQDLFAQTQTTHRNRHALIPPPDGLDIFIVVPCLSHSGALICGSIVNTSARLL